MRPILGLCPVFVSGSAKGFVVNFGLPLRDYIHMLRSNAGLGVKIHYDEYSEQCQNTFK